METLKSKLKVVWAVAVVILLTAPVGTQAADGELPWYTGYTNIECTGHAYLWTTSLATIQREIQAKKLVSYRNVDTRLCVTVSVSSDR